MSHPTKPRKRILFATDFSPAAEAVFTYALRRARRDEAELILLHVIEPQSPLADELALALEGSARDAVEAAARKSFDGLLARAKAANVPAADVVREGRPADEIVSVAVSERADVSVMGTHGRTGLRRLMLVSVAERVLAGAPCPVVTIRNEITGRLGACPPAC